MYWLYFSLDTELLFRDATGGLSILTLTNYAQTQILSNTTFVSCNQCITNAIIDFSFVLTETLQCSQILLISKPKICFTHARRQKGEL